MADSTRAIASASTARAGRSFSHHPMAAEIGSGGRAFQLSFGKTPAGRNPDYFTGTWATWGQTAASSASFSAPVAFLGVSSRHLAGIAKGVEGL